MKGNMFGIQKSYWNYSDDFSECNYTDYEKSWYINKWDLFSYTKGRGQNVFDHLWLWRLGIHLDRPTFNFLPWAVLVEWNGDKDLIDYRWTSNI